MSIFERLTANFTLKDLTHRGEVSTADSVVRKRRTSASRSGSILGTFSLSLWFHDKKLPLDGSSRTRLER